MEEQPHKKGSGSGFRSRPLQASNANATASTSTSTGAPSSAVLPSPLTRPRAPVAAPDVVTDPPQAPHHPRLRAQPGRRAAQHAPRVQVASLSSTSVSATVEADLFAAYAQLAGANTQLVIAQAQQAELDTALPHGVTLAARPSQARPPVRSPLRPAPASFRASHGASSAPLRCTAWYTQYIPSSGPFPPCPYARECEIAQRVHTDSSDAPRSSSVHTLFVTPPPRRAHWRAHGCTADSSSRAPCVPHLPESTPSPSAFTPPRAFTYTAHSSPRVLLNLNSPHAQIE
ncbi:hypothetical protein FB451DRAFT_1461840 [Mycena latifolia]|nr:hypothetical protein FB451DRAFT_1461840 [Mycena latifolia]